MPIYTFVCSRCDKGYEDLTPYDDSGRYPGISCPFCGSPQKEKVPSTFAFNFSNPEGTDRWNSGSGGHDYRFKAKAPQVKADRELAEAASHMGAQPYTWGSDAGKYDTGVHDV